jgi:hypothetical protein
MQTRGDRGGAADHLRSAQRMFTALQVPRYIARAEVVARAFQISL